MHKISAVDPSVNLLSADDEFLFNEGSHTKLYNHLGAHPIVENGVSGVHFAVWAPEAKEVHVVGDFNDWDPSAHPLSGRGSSGVWGGFIPGVKKGDKYKFAIGSCLDGRTLEKADPFAFYCETPPKSASVVWDLDYQWKDDGWMESRGDHNSQSAPISIYEMHLGSWKRGQKNPTRFLTYRELATELPVYLSKMNYTHVEFLPVMEHPFYGSWGYQVTGYFAPTSRYGTPQDFMHLIDTLHQMGIGVILDWVPSHFTTDGHALGVFDGSHLYEHSDPREGFHQDWGSYIFNYGRHEVRSFLLSSAIYWMDKFHIDGYRVDAVASMLYRDYSREEGEWIPNKYGGRENLEAIDFLRRFNLEVYKQFPDTVTIAEESTDWPMVSRPNYVGGLGFGHKWDMGWMHDMLSYMSKNPVYRKFHHNGITFRMLYAFNEHFVLPLSHDEVTHGKKSLLSKMPGDNWQQFANLRLLYGYMYGQPGKKLLFMGGEIGQWREWVHDEGLEWHLLEYPIHGGLHKWVEDLNRLYRDEPALHELDSQPDGFEWIDCNDSLQSTVSFLRRGKNEKDLFLIACNFTPIPREEQIVGAPRGGFWKEMLNSDAMEYGGSGVGNAGGVMASEEPFHGRPHSLTITIPPLGVVFFKSTEDGEEESPQT